MPVSPTKVLYRPASNTGNDLTGAVMRDLGEQSVAPAGDYVPWAMAADPNGAITIGAAPTAPAQMSAPTVTATGANSISVDLAAAPADGGSAITSYDLRYSTDETNWTEVSDVSDPETVSGLTADTLYYVQTRAVNAVDADPSNWSTSGTATTDAASSALFVEDFESYSVGQELELHSNYTTGPAANINTFVVDVSGDKMAEPAQGVSWPLYDGATSFPDSRETRYTIDRLGSGANIYFYGTYVDDSNNSEVQVDGSGLVKLRARISGAYASMTATGAISDGDTLVIRNDAGTLTVLVDDGVSETLIHTNAASFTVTGGTIGVRTSATSATVLPRISKFEVRSV